MAWAPAPARPLPTPFSNRKASLGQTSALDSPVTALATDMVVLAGSAFMAWGTGTKNNKWSTFWWVVSGITLVKALHDMSRI